MSTEKNLLHTSKQNNFSKLVYNLFNKISRNFVDNQEKNFNHSLQSSLIQAEPDPIAYYFILPIAIKLAKIDSEINQLEKSSIFVEMKKLGFQGDNMQECFNDLSKEEINFEVYTNKLKLLRHNNNNFFFKIIQMLLIIAIADGSLLSSELAFIKRIASMLDIDSNSLNDIIAKQISIPKNPDPYLELGIEKNISKEDFKARYRQLAKQFHPDNFSNNNSISDEYKLTLQEKFHSINKAYNSLKHIFD